MSSNNQFETGMALNCLSNVCTTDLARDLVSDVIALLASSRAYIRKKGVLVMFKIFLQFPDALRPSFPRLKEKLDDSGVPCAWCLTPSYSGPGSWGMPPEEKKRRRLRAYNMPTVSTSSRLPTDYRLPCPCACANDVGMVTRMNCVLLLFFFGVCGRSLVTWISPPPPAMGGNHHLAQKA